jgi:hypothetical protein
MRANCGGIFKRVVYSGRHNEKRGGVGIETNPCLNSGLHHQGYPRRGIRSVLLSMSRGGVFYVLMVA